MGCEYARVGIGYVGQFVVPNFKLYQLLIEMQIWLTVSELSGRPQLINCVVCKK